MAAGYRWVDDSQIVGTISYNALISEIGRPAASSAVGRIHHSSAPSPLIPSHEYLQVGDIVLSGYPKKDNGKHKWHPVRQSQIKQGCDPESSRWTHAMLYVGQLHVVESNKPTKLKTGVALAPLTRDAHLHEFLVLRYKGSDFATRRQDIVRYALMSPGLIPRRYDVFGAISSHFRWRPKGASHSERILLQRVCAGVLWHHGAVFGAGVHGCARR